MIRHFRDPEAELIFRRQRSRKLPSNIQAAALRKLNMLEAAKDITDLRLPPGNRLEKLTGDLEGLHSIRINSQWRVVFRWEQEGAFDVQIVDYHG